MAPINVCVIIRGELAIGRIFAPRTSHEGGAVKARPYRCRRQSGQEAVLPHRRTFPRRRALPHQSGSRRLTGPRAEPQLLFCFINQSLLMLALWSCGRRAASSKRSGKSTVFCAGHQHHRWPDNASSHPDCRATCHLPTCRFRCRIRGSSPICWLRLQCPQNLTFGRRSQSG